MMRDDVWAVAEPVLSRTLEHPFWAGVRDGTLPDDALWYFAEQDARQVVPGYAGALTRAAARAPRAAYGSLLCSAATATFDAVVRMAGELDQLADELGRPAAGGGGPAGPAVHAHTCFMAAATMESFTAAVGGLLPMTWFHLAVSDDLRRHTKPASRHAAWVERYCPEEAGYRRYVEAYLDMLDDTGARCSAAERARLVEWFRLGAHHELAFADAAWRRQTWPT